MQYPIPTAPQYFYYKQKKNKTIQNQLPQIPTSATQEKLTILKKYERLRKHLPYIEHIYLCDSMSFNASHTGSDIDLLFITTHWCTRRARLLSVVIFRVLGIKRTLHKKAGLFDLIFYIDANHTNIEHIALQPEDIYLSYRLAHLIPIYQKKPYNIYTDNKRIQKILPNFPMTHTPQLTIQTQTGSSRQKKIRESLRGKGRDNLWEYLGKSLRKPLVIRKKERHKSQWRWIIITDFMLKFHKDKRKDIQQKRETYKSIE